MRLRNLFLLLVFCVLVTPALAQESGFTSKDAQFSLTFPSSYTTNTVKGQSGQVHTLGSIDGQNIYMAKFGVNEKPMIKEKWSEYLKRLHDVYAVGSGDHKVENVDMGKLKGKQIRIIENVDGEKIYKYLRILVTEKSWYTLQVYSYADFPDDQLVKKFFNSFELL